MTQVTHGQHPGRMRLLVPHWARVWLPVASTVAFLAWTALAVLDVLDPVDRALAVPLPHDAVGQVLAAVSIVTMPVVLSLGLVLLAWWAHQVRLRNLAAAILLATALGWGGVRLAKVLVASPRPDWAPDLISSQGHGYPSGHMATIVTVVIMVTATMVTTRTSHTTALGWRIGGLLLVLAMAVDRWWLGAHWFSDIVGGALWGLAVSLWALLATGMLSNPVGTEPATGEVEATEGGEARLRCAVIYNPSKIADVPTFMRHVEYELESRGWRRAIWLETSVQDPGREMTAIAVRKNVDLVIGAGGDGTIRVICDGLANTGIPLGIVAAGTGNLLARNLAIPMDEARALSTAFDGATRRIDLVRVEAGDRPPERFCAFAGIGVDAVIVGEANADLKRAIGSGAYFVSAAQHARHPALDTEVVADGTRFRRRAHLVVLGNVGLLQGGIHLIPDARPDDGRMDLMVAAPRTARDWVELTGRVLARRERVDDRLIRMRAKRVEITVDPADRYELDGDPQGTCSRLVAEVEPGALHLRVPR